MVQTTTRYEEDTSGLLANLACSYGGIPFCGLGGCGGLRQRLIEARCQKLSNECNSGTDKNKIRSGYAHWSGHACHLGELGLIPLRQGITVAEFDLMLVRMLESSSKFLLIS